MRCTLIAHTVTTLDFAALAMELGWEPTSDVAAEQLLEFAGRSCYQSWSKPNPATFNTEDYIAHILAVNHLSVVEHASISFYLEDVSRSLTHELVRHRHFSFSQLSQRYVDMAGARPVVHPLLRDDTEAEDILYASFVAALGAYEELAQHLARKHPQLGQKKIREAAREVLPNCTPTSIVVTGNLRSWLEFIEKRCSPAADAAIREAAEAMLHELQLAVPAVFVEPPKTLNEQLDIMYDPPAVQPEFPS